jgi:hypothetical protein
MSTLVKPWSERKVTARSLCVRYRSPPLSDSTNAIRPTPTVAALRSYLLSDFVSYDSPRRLPRGPSSSVQALLLRIVQPRPVVPSLATHSFRLYRATL